MHMKRYTPVRLLIVTVIILLFTAAGCGKKKNTTDVAIINGKPITKVAFQKEMDRIKKRFSSKAASDEKQMARIQREVLDIIIGGELLYQASQEKGIKVTDQEINSELDKIQQKFSGPDELKRSFDQEDIRKKIAIEKFIDQEFASQTIISDEESRKYYEDNKDDFIKPEQVLASHILIKVDENASPEDTEAARQKLGELREKIISGQETFEDAAKQYSEDSTASIGGTLGYFMRGQMVEPFEKVAFNLEPNKVSEIVETKFGYHIIKVMDKKPYYVIAYEEVEDKLKSFLKQQKVQAKVNNFIKQQKEQAKIEIFLDDTAAS